MVLASKKMAKHFFLFCIFSELFLSFISIVVAETGIASFYLAPYAPSTCNGNKYDGLMIGAASDEIWHDGAACGREYIVQCEGATNGGPDPCRGNTYVIVKIVDYCPPGCQGTIELSLEAFAAIADPNAGEIQISFH